MVCCGVRYGNVMYSRGSVIPLFMKQIMSGQPLTVTNAKMTRLLLPLAEAVRLVTFAMEHGEQGDILVRKATAASIGTLAKAMLNVFDANNPIKTIGTRAGEKVHEVLISAEELTRAEDCGDFYRVRCDRGRDYAQYFERGSLSASMVREGYTSENARQLSVAEVVTLLRELPEIRRDLEERRRQTPALRRLAA
jgi:UDP-glucose 4-epimerase